MYNVRNQANAAYTGTGKEVGEGGGSLWSGVLDYITVTPFFNLHNVPRK